MPGVCTDVVPALSSNIVDRSLGSYQTPCTPPLKRESGVKALNEGLVSTQELSALANLRLEGLM